MKIYTKKGDTGDTALANGKKLPKSEIRVEAYGDIDELNSCIGFVVSQDLEKLFAELLTQVQRDLFVLGSLVAETKIDLPALSVDYLESAIDQEWEKLPALKNFILPGGSLFASSLHVARSVCRRAERSLVRLAHAEFGTIEAEWITYLNRLSDTLFVLARAANHAAKIPDVEWLGAKDHH